ncbi:MAG: chromosomal replication initiator protein DnaA [Clostridiales bacterium]|nr:chromosomal replication initiator protein DnaA [Clostridiales bacterium]
MQLANYWSRIAEAVKLNSDISVPSWNAFIKPLKPLNMEDGAITLEAPTFIIKNTVETKYIDIIQEQADFIVKSPCMIKIVDSDTKHKEPETLKIISRNSVISNYSFENFIVGESNQFAYAASVAVAESPGIEYNPLFLYGDVGLGKTHLMHAIANFILKHNPESKIAYIPCEKFMNELIGSIRNKTNEQFREKYRNLDVLLIDDIQFINGKDSTQDEFFHTFNTLYNDQKQIIMASDRHPNEIKALTDRLRSRFKSGLLVDIKPPDFETRTAILQKKAEELNEDVPDDVLQFIAHSVKSNIRELEGAFTRVMAYKKLINKPIDLAAAKEALNDVNENTITHAELTIENVQNIVCETYGITVDDLVSKKRTKPLSTYRQIAEYLCRKYVRNVTLTEIAANFGGQNHTSVRTAVDKIQSQIKEDKNVAQLVEAVELKLIF